MIQTTLFLYVFCPPVDTINTSIHKRTTTFMLGSVKQSTTRGAMRGKVIKVPVQLVMHHTVILTSGVWIQLLTFVSCQIPPLSHIFPVSLNCIQPNEAEMPLKDAVMYLLRHSGCQVPPSAVPSNSDASWVHGVLSQQALLEEVFDHAVHILIWDREVVCWGQAVPSGNRGVADRSTWRKNV